MRIISLVCFMLVAGAAAADGGPLCKHPKRGLESCKPGDILEVFGAMYHCCAT